jgi:hypothetical protein
MRRAHNPSTRLLRTLIARLSARLSRNELCSQTARKSRTEWPTNRPLSGPLADKLVGELRWVRLGLSRTLESMGLYLVK